MMIRLNGAVSSAIFCVLSPIKIVANDFALIALSQLKKEV